MAVNPLKSGEEIIDLPVSRLIRSFFQPRELFDPEKMKATRESIREKGQMYPVVVRPILPGNKLYDSSWGEEVFYELADGERRYRCCKELGFETIRAVVRSLTDEQMLDYTLTTNDSVPLNPIERSRVFYRLADEFGKTQAEIAKSYNLKQQQVSEYIRLLDLPEEIQDYTARAVISVRHARELLKISSDDMRLELGRRAAEERMSTRQLAGVVKERLKPEKSRIHKDKIKNDDIAFEVPAAKRGQSEGKDDLISSIFEVKAEEKPKSASEGGTNGEERRLVTSSFPQKGGFGLLFDAFLDFFGQLTALFLFGTLRTALAKHMRRTPGLEKVKPENYLTLIGFCVIGATVLFFALFHYLPIAAMGVGAFLGSYFLYKVWERWQTRY